MKTFYLSLLDPAGIRFPAGSPVDFMVHRDWILASYTDHRFVSKLCSVSPCCTATPSVGLVALLGSCPLWHPLCSLDAYKTEDG